MPEQTSLTEQAGRSPDGSENGEVRVLPEDERPDDRPSREALLEAVNNRRRRYALHYLQTYGGREPVDLADVSRQVAAWERGVGVDVISYEERKNVHTSLYQFHAPKLDEIGLVEYQKRRSTVRLTEHGRNLTLVIDVNDERFGVPTYVPVLSGLSVATVAGAWLGIPVISAVPDIGWATLVASAFAFTSVLLVRQRNGEQVVTEHPPEPTDES
jgi:hypothetical protein